MSLSIEKLFIASPPEDLIEGLLSYPVGFALGLNPADTSGIWKRNRSVIQQPKPPTVSSNSGMKQADDMIAVLKLNRPESI